GRARIGPSPPPRPPGPRRRCPRPAPPDLQLVQPDADQRRPRQGRRPPGAPLPVSSAPGCVDARSPRREDQRKVGTSTRSVIGGQLLTTPAQLVASLTLLVAAIGLPTKVGAAWGNFAAPHFPCLTSPCLCVSVVESTPAPHAVRLEAVS